MESDWEDIRRLAADLQRVQLTDTAQRLSERCVVELVGRLLKEQRLMLIHSRDGKDILTLDQLEREIIDEVHAHGGRANLSDLQQLLNVDVCHVEARAVDMCRSDKELTLILGQILHSSYLDRMGEDVNDRLREAGFVNVSELCKVYDLPTDFLTEVLRERLGSLVSGRGDALDLGVIYTDAFVSRHRARIRGLFTAITRPTSVHNLINQFGFQERLFYTMLEELVKAGRLKGSLVGGRREHSVFVPQLYARTQNQWVDNFLSLNGFLELEALSRLGIPDPDGWVRRRYEGTGLVRLATAYVRPSLIDAVHAALDEAMATGTWVDVQPLLPSSLSPADIEGVLRSWAGGGRAAPAHTVLCGRLVASPDFLASCLELFQESVRAHASQEALRVPALVISEQQLLSLSSCASTAPAEQADERRRRVHDTKASRGNAREVKTKKQKRPRGKGDPTDDDDDLHHHHQHHQGSGGRGHVPPPSYPPLAEVKDVLGKKFPELDRDAIAELAEELSRPLSQAYDAALQSVLLAATPGDPGGSRRRQGGRELQEELTASVANIRLFLRGALLFPDDVQPNLSRHLLKTLCTDVGNSVFASLASDASSPEAAGPITAEARLRILGKMPDDLRRPLVRLHAVMGGKVLAAGLAIIISTTRKHLAHRGAWRSSCRLWRRPLRLVTS
uniref:E3 UFM1-protein ligase 1 n=1 Tax=Petromyzon marinus TaxID=7757 RepID=A0AAJ7UEK9_PETMA|nr:E3 UFM1-protein ligase 1 isoform X2 [Petromyzon marinus]